MPGNTEIAIRNFVADNFMYRERVESLGDTESFLERGLIDSTGVLELVCFVEKTFGIKVSDDEVVPENLDSIQRIASLIQRKLAASPAKCVA